MTPSLKPYVPVRVHIGDALFVRDTKFYQYDPANEEYCEVLIQGRIYGVPLDLVEPVTPPCPWTENATVISYDGGKGHYRTIARLQGDTWHRLNDFAVLDYATDIAPFNPVRLVPENPQSATTVRSPHGSVSL